MKIQRATYKVKEAAQVAGVGETAIRVGIKAGHVPHILFGRNILIPKIAFHRWLDSCGGLIAADQQPETAGAAR